MTSQSASLDPADRTTARGQSGTAGTPTAPLGGPQVDDVAPALPLAAAGGGAALAGGGAAEASSDTKESQGGVHVTVERPRLRAANVSRLASDATSLEANFGTRPGVTIALVSAAIALAFAYISTRLPQRMEAYPTFALLASLAYGWPSLIGIPSRRGGPLVIAFSGLSAIILLQLTGNYAWSVVVMGFALIAAFIHQMAREGGRPGLVESVAGIVTGALIALAGTGWLALTTSAAMLPFVGVGGISLAAAGLVTAIPGNWTTRLAACTLAAVGGAYGASRWLLPLSAGEHLFVGGLLGLLVGLTVAFVRLAAWPALLNREGGLRLHRAELAAYALPVMLTGVVVYAVARVLVG
ncbi:hypothetical protein ABYF34_01810 [Buchananella felis]|uniref:hypothetical protein n=1 Tax=Buchananella felis TaxID=3231492 RepID=UPI0035292E17